MIYREFCTDHSKTNLMHPSIRIIGDWANCSSENKKHRFQKEVIGGAKLSTTLNFSTRREIKKR